MRYLRWVQLLLVLSVVLVGALMPVQAGINGEFRRFAGHPVLAAALNFVVGLGALLAAVFALRVPWPSLSRLGEAPAWAWLGGLCGASLVLSAVVAAPRLGASLLVVCLVAGQLGASLVIDHFGLVGYAVRPIALTRLFGVLLVAAGVYLVQRAGS